MVESSLMQVTPNGAPPHDSAAQRPPAAQLAQGSGAR
jgi:hypothetical protein